jgi:aryl-alcohol dehydrogenase-like predicted oxidoreductase
LPSSSHGRNELAWCLKNPHISTVITGASRPQQVTENMKALEIAPKITTEIMERVEGVLQNKPQV